ncbi:MAG TPA: DUF3224 domain-containing protein [Longimicrobium sp.]|nr:DUF3224 domain-containing protein [Longimicrobium sp.]
MKHLTRAAAALAGVCLSLALAGSVRAQAAGTPSNTQTETAVSTRATGTFEVQLAPQETAATIGRMSLDKQFHGDLEGTSKGEMLAVQGGVQGSAGYVALEQVTGTLHGRTGTFYLQHTGTMDRGAPSLSITVVPDSGTGELTGLSGRMNIVIEAGKHSYEFDYTLPGTS